MNKTSKGIISVVLFIIIISGIVVFTTYVPGNSNVYFASAYDDNSLKELGVTLTSTNISPKIDKNEVRKIAKDMQQRSSLRPKGIYIEYGLITSNNFTINVISKEAKDANPTLKDKKSISDIPVWIITFKGLLPEEYKQDTNMVGKQPLDISSTVIDAMSGKVLFGFGMGKNNKTLD
jgi:hypothetical protein